MGDEELLAAIDSGTNSRPRCRHTRLVADRLPDHAQRMLLHAGLARRTTYGTFFGEVRRGGANHTSLGRCLVWFRWVQMNLAPGLGRRRNLIHELLQTATP